MEDAQCQCVPDMCVDDGLPHSHFKHHTSPISRSAIGPWLPLPRRHLRPPPLPPPSPKDIKWRAYFALLRARRQHAQVTHVFIPCHVHDDGALSLQQRPEWRLFEYMSPWGLARLLLSLGASEVHVHKLLHRSHEAASVLVEPEDDHGRALWPELQRRPGGAVQPSRAACEAAAMLEAAELPRTGRRQRRKARSSHSESEGIGLGPIAGMQSDSEDGGAFPEGSSGEGGSGGEDCSLLSWLGDGLAGGAREPVGGAGQPAQGLSQSAAPALSSSGAAQPAAGSGPAQGLSQSAAPAPSSSGAAQPAAGSGHCRGARRRKEGYQTFEVEGVGHFVFDIAASSLAAHCRGYGHGPCRANKVLRKAPIGGFVAWLREGASHTTQRSHMQVWHNRSAEDGPLSHERRRAARESLPDTASTRELLALEREFCSGDGAAGVPTVEPLLLV